MKHKRIKRFALILLLFIFTGFVLISAARDNSKNNKQWREFIIQHRQQKDLEFKTSPTSPMAAVKRLLVKPGQQTFVIESNREITLSQQKGPGTQFSLARQKNQWIWQAHAPTVTCKISGKTAVSGSPLHQGALLHTGNCVMAAYPSKDNLVLLVFDPLRQEMKDFAHLVYFPPSPEFAVPAILKKFPRVTKMTMLTSQNLEKTYYRWAAVNFQLEGKKLQLTAFKFNLQGDGSDILFIPFGDKTNGKETYGSGRFLEIPEPHESHFILDFNLCYNPLCNYAHDAYNCPLPPLENILDVPIKAGEKTYPH